MALGISEAQLLGLFLESVFWGIQLVTYISCLHTIFGDCDGVHAKRKFIAAVSTVFLLMTTLNEGLIVHNTLDAFVYYEGRGGPAARFATFPPVNTVLRAITLGLTTMLGDGVLVWRCWELHQRRWLPVAFPTLLWLTCIALGFAGVITQLTADRTVIATSIEIRHILTSYWVCTFVLNLTTTGTIIWRLWGAEKKAREVGLDRYGTGVHGSKPLQVSGESRSKIMNAIYTVSESGLLFTLSILACLVTHTTLPNALYPASCVLIQAAGIAFNLIIIRTAQRTRQAAAHARSNQQGVSLRNLGSMEESRDSGTNEHKSATRTYTPPKAMGVFVQTSMTSYSDNFKPSR